MKRLFIAIFAVLMFASCANKPKELTPTQQFEQALTDSIKDWWGKSGRAFLLTDYDSLVNKKIAYVHVDTMLYLHTDLTNVYLSEISKKEKFLQANAEDVEDYKVKKRGASSTMRNLYQEFINDRMKLQESCQHDIDSLNNLIEKIKAEYNKGYLVKFDCEVPAFKGMVSTFDFVILGDTLCAVPVLVELDDMEHSFKLDKTNLSYKDIQ